MADLDVTKIDRQAWAWRKKLIECWCGQPIKDDASLIAALCLEHGMNDGPLLPYDRLDLIGMATRREDPSKEAFVTLALVDFIEDLATLPIGERTAKLPYQLAWARAGFSLVERTGLPGGIFRAAWPEVGRDELEPRRAPRQPHPEPSGWTDRVPEVRVDRSPDLPPKPVQDRLPGVDIEPVSRVRGALGGVDLGAGLPERKRRPRVPQPAVPVR